MSWVEIEDYLGPDRRHGRRLRLIERRSSDISQPAPSLQLLLRKLQIWAASVTPANASAVERYCARLDVVSKLARERGAFGAGAQLAALAKALRARPACNVADASARHIRTAMASLNEPVGAALHRSTEED